MALVSTIHGDMEESLLEYKSGIDTIPEGEAHWSEYWLESELVHRSVHLFVKEGTLLNVDAAVLA